MTNYRILTVTPFFLPEKSMGLVNHVVNITSRLAKLGHEVTVISPKHFGDKKTARLDNIKVHRINSIYLPGWPYSTLKSFSYPLDFGKIDSIIKKGSFDVVHVHGHHFPIVWKAIDSAKKHGIPIVLTLHGMWALNPNVLGGKSNLEEYFNKTKFSKVLSKVDAVIGLTDQIIEHAKKYERKPVKHFVIPNGVDTKKYQENLGRKLEFREKYGLSQSSIVVFFGNRFEEVKGIKELADAIKSSNDLDSFEFLIVGSGSLDDYVKNKLKGLKNVHLLGWQPAELMHEFYIASDVCIMPSKFEALPLSLMEAMNAGVHIIYTDVGGIPDIIKGYKSKTLLGKVSPQEILTVIKNLGINYVKNTDEKSLRYARNFDWDSLTIKVRSVYDSLIL